MKAILSDQTTLKADFYIDSDKQIRKSQLDLHIPVADPNSGISALKLTTSFENWNLGKPVTADTIDTSGGVMKADSDTFKGYAILNNFDRNSLFYKLLREDLKMTHKELRFIVASNQGEGKPYGLAAIYQQGSGDMVPVRFLSSSSAPRSNGMRN